MSRANRMWGVAVVLGLLLTGANVGLAQAATPTLPIAGSDAATVETATSRVDARWVMLGGFLVVLLVGVAIGITIQRRAPARPADDVETVKLRVPVGVKRAAQRAKGQPKSPDEDA